MRHKEKRLIFIGMTCSAVIGVYLGFIVSYKCKSLSEYRRLEKAHRRAQSDFKVHEAATESLLEQREQLLAIKKAWMPYLKKVPDINQLWSEIARLAVSMNLLSRLQEEQGLSGVIEIDGKLDNLLELIREIENLFPQMKFKSLAFKPSVYGEVNLLMTIALPEAQQC